MADANVGLADLCNDRLYVTYSRVRMVLPGRQQRTRVSVRNTIKLSTTPPDKLLTELSLAGRWVRRYLSSSTDVCPLCPDGISMTNKCGGQTHKNKRTPFFWSSSPVLIKSDHLPRQAQDKQKDSSKRARPFLSFRRYAHSMYTVFKLGDMYAVSGAEKGFAIFSDIILIIIQGALAGMFSQLMMASKVGENDYLVKLAQLKAWMVSRRFSTDRQRR